MIIKIILQKIKWEEDAKMQMKTFLWAMGAGVAVGALGAMMLPKSSGAYRFTKDAAQMIQDGAEKAIDSIGGCK